MPFQEPMLLRMTFEVPTRYRDASDAAKTAESASTGRTGASARKVSEEDSVRNVSVNFLVPTTFDLFG